MSRAADLIERLAAIETVAFNREREGAPGPYDLIQELASIVRGVLDGSAGVAIMDVRTSEDME